MEYKNKEDGTIKEIVEIRTEYKELLENTNEFEEYRYNFNKYFEDYYEELPIYIVTKDSDSVIITEKSFKTIDNESNQHWFNQLIQDNKIIREWSDIEEEEYWKGEETKNKYNTPIEEQWDIYDFLPCEDRDEEQLIAYLDNNNIGHDDGEETKINLQENNAYGATYKYYYQELRYEVSNLSQKQIEELEEMGFEVN